MLSRFKDSWLETPSQSRSHLARPAITERKKGSRESLCEEDETRTLTTCGLALETLEAVARGGGAKLMERKKDYSSVMVRADDWWMKTHDN